MWSMMKKILIVAIVLMGMNVMSAVVHAQSIYDPYLVGDPYDTYMDMLDQYEREVNKELGWPSPDPDPCFVCNMGPLDTDAIIGAMIKNVEDSTYLSPAK